jgi:hypothetical protein
VGIPTAGTYIVDGKLTLPALQEGSAKDSQCVATVSRNSTVIYTSNPGDRGFNTSIPCSAADVISIVISSADATETRMRCTVAVG